MRKQCVWSIWLLKKWSPPSNELGSTKPRIKRIASESAQKWKVPENIGFYPIYRAWVLEIVSIILGILIFLGMYEFVCPSLR